VETLIGAIILTILNVAQLALLGWIQQRTKIVRQELADVLEWARQPEHVPGDRYPD
jgi:hypothetical protein